MAASDAVLVEKCWKSLASDESCDGVVYALADGTVKIKAVGIRVMDISFDRNDWSRIRAMVDRLTGVVADVPRPESVVMSAPVHGAAQPSAKARVIEKNEGTGEAAEVPEAVIAFLKANGVDGQWGLSRNDYDEVRGDLPFSATMMKACGLKWSEITALAGLKLAGGRTAGAIAKLRAESREAGVAVEPTLHFRNGNGFHPAFVDKLGGPDDASSENAGSA